jgi:DnaK suppressor protein
MSVSPITSPSTISTEYAARRVHSDKSRGAPDATPASLPTQAAEAVTLTPAQLGELRAALVRYREHRLRQLDALDAQPAGAHVVAVAHRATVEQLLRDIEASLARLDAGTYGRCQYCAKPMHFGRLVRLPYARGCDRCVRIAAGW